jgi:hypothetical protein
VYHSASNNNHYRGSLCFSYNKGGETWVAGAGHSALSDNPSFPIDTMDKSLMLDGGRVLDQENGTVIATVNRVQVSVRLVSFLGASVSLLNQTCFHVCYFRATLTSSLPA